MLQEGIIARSSIVSFSEISLNVEKSMVVYGGQLEGKGGVTNEMLCLNLESKEWFKVSVEGGKKSGLSQSACVGAYEDPYTPTSFS